MRTTNKQLTEEQIDEIITKYILYFAKNQDFARYKDASDLYNLLNQNEIVYHYESQSNPIWSFEPLEGGKPAFQGHVSDAGYEMLYDMIHYSSEIETK